MEPLDVRYFMLILQRRVQLYIDERLINGDNTTGFLVSYNQLIRGLYPRWYGVPVVEFDYDEVEGENLPDLPDDWKACHQSDFRAIVKATFTRNSEEYTFTFRSGFRVGVGSI